MSLPTPVIDGNMRKKTQAIIAIGVVAVVVLVFVATSTLYYLRDDNGGQMLWNANEAYLFMGVARRGFRVRSPDYPWIALMEWFNAPASPSDQRVFLTVIHVTQSGVERHLGQLVKQTADSPMFFTPIDQTIYADCQGNLCKWVGDHFDNATHEEQQKLDIHHLPPDIDGPINGWSKRGVGDVAGDFQFAVEIGQGVTVRVRQGNIYKSTTATVDLERVGEPTQHLWHVNGQPRRVSKREYEQTLSAIEGK